MLKSLRVDQIYKVFKSFSLFVTSILIPIDKEKTNEITNGLKINEIVAFTIL